ncbi:hypothetical protein DCS32_04985 [Dokdonia sp. Dokd-P16]|uniref:GLPGLI family protein n=1 Tax=Dokdonia sp. Dokd-P16 TaxID=2173169 RepID=UPI000D543DF0|nr:GLPGLI family protein [Dokdonia sp. Dokd-P16]AWH73532.1 hypothetical protein DCS32_04985 [Dokdonia sp. Dokd-P16]
MKNYRIYLLLVFVCSGFNLGAQSIDISGIVTYHQETNLAYLYEEDYSLYFDKNQSLYLENIGKKKSNQEKSNQQGNETTRSIIVGRSNISQQYYHYKEGRFTYREIWFDEPLYVEDKITFNWELIDKTKLIGSFLCKKAKVLYRGRIYYAWYALQIPYNYGPWKFRGLPGLILEVEEENSKFRITASKIALGDTINEFEIPEKRNLLSIPAFLLEKERLNNELLARINSKAAKGSQPLKASSDCDDCKTLQLEWYNN